jgi:predicted outer membrane repeat protein
MNTSPNSENDFFGDDDGSDNGGAVYLENGSLTVNDVDFINSVSADSSGQAIAAINADVEINNSTFDNTTGWDWFDSLLNEGDGGAVYVSSDDSSNPNPTVTIDNSTFQNLGTQGNGGAIALDCADATISDSYFYDNTSGYQGGAVFAYGQEGDCDSTGSLTIDNSVFEGNQTQNDFGGEGNGGAGGGAVSVVYQPLTVTNSNFGDEGDGNGSTDGSGGAIWLDGTSGTLLTISDTEFIDNTSGWWNGGAIATHCANVVITGDATGTASDIEDGASTFFLGNYADDNGGAVMTSGENCNDDGGDGSSDEYVTTTITGAIFSSNSIEGQEGQGGAVANENSGFSWLASFNVSTTTFVNNTAEQAGGALDTDYTDATISNSYFALNEADDDGGAIESCSANITLNNTDFYDNNVLGSAGNGGAVMFNDICGRDNVSLQITGSSFDSNDGGSDDEGGAIARYGDGTGDDFIKNSTFNSNNSGYGGGGIYTEADLLVSNSTFDDNHANYSNGGAIAVDNDNVSELTIINSTFTDNTSGYAGGAIATYRGMVTISGSTFDGNSSFTGGGAIRVGAGTCCGDNYSFGLSISNSLFSNNDASQGYRSGDGGAVHFDGSTGADFSVSNTRFIDNTVGNGEGGAIYASLDGDQVFGTGIMTVDKSTFTGNYSGQDGGAINHDANSSQTTFFSLTNSTFNGNTAESAGGAIDMTDAAFISGNRFVNNTSLFDNAGALQLNEAGQTGVSIVTKNSFENNAAGTAQGYSSVEADGGAIEFDREVVITNNSFTRNRAVGSLSSDGGAIEGSGFDTTLSGNSFLYNSATGDGGAVDFYDFSYDYAKSKITGNTFDSNAAGDGGGALWIDDNEAINDFKAQISDNRILRNTAAYGAGIYITWAEGPAKHNAPTGILKNVFERNVAAMNGGAILIEYYGGAYRDSRAAQQALLKATKNNRYVGNKANRDRSTATVGGWNVGVGPFVLAAYETEDAPEARKVPGTGAKVEK